MESQMELGTVPQTFDQLFEEIEKLDPRYNDEEEMYQFTADFASEDRHGNLAQ